MSVTGGMGMDAVRSLEALRVLEDAAYNPTALPAALDLAAKELEITSIGLFDARRLPSPVASE